MIDLDENDEPHSGHNGQENAGGASGRAKDKNGLLGRLGWLLRGRSETSLREAIEDYIEEADNDDEDTDSISAHERALIGNILKLQDLKVVDVMIPRADIIAVDINISEQEILSLLSEKQHSRLPVYRDNLDEVVGSIHIKDILACLAAKEDLHIENLIRDVPIVSPSMTVPDLLLMMRQMRKHMALVVDEFGGIDGLVTIGDVIESIVGEIDDEYDLDDDPVIFENKDGSITADARAPLDEFQEQYGYFLSEEELEDIDTIGGLIFALAGRVPGRGEILSHECGISFEIIDADPRRVNRVIVRNLPLPLDAASA